MRFPDFFADFLLHQRVKYVFGIPGGDLLPYLEAFNKAGIHFISVANEASAGIMADVTARFTGIPGVCVATYGAGATNLLTGVGCAFLDRSPLIAVTSEFPREMLNRKIQMNIDHQLLFSSITKYTASLNKYTAVTAIENAFEISVAEVPGPVHLGIPSNMADEDIQEKIYGIDSNTKSFYTPEKFLFKKAEEILKKSQKPVFAVGLTAARLKVGNLLLRIVEKYKVPVLLTPMAKGLLKEDNCCYAGVLFHGLSHMIAEIYRQADLIIGIGYDPVEFRYEDWMPDVPLIHLDTSIADIEKNVEVLNIIGDLNNILNEFTKIEIGYFRWNINKIAEVKDKIFKELEPNNCCFGPRAVIKAVRENLCEKGIMTCDVGAHTHLIGQAWKTPESGLQIMTNGWSTMGFGVPSAIAAKLCKPDRKVVCISGDGGFLMMAGELITARRLGLSIVFVILADKYYSLIQVKQNNKKYTNIGVELYRGEYFGADMFFGVPVFTVASIEQMYDALGKAFLMDGLVIIEAVVDGSEYNKLISTVHK